MTERERTVCEGCGRVMLDDEWPGCDTEPCPLWQIFGHRCRRKPDGFTSWAELEEHLIRRFSTKH